MDIEEEKKEVDNKEEVDDRDIKKGKKDKKKKKAKKNKKAKKEKKPKKEKRKKKSRKKAKKDEGVEESVPESGEPKQPKKKRTFLKYMLLLQGSMVVVFLTVWIAVSRMESARRAEEPATGAAVIDSAAVEIVQEPEAEIVQKDTADVKTEEDKIKEEKLKLIEQLAVFREQLAQKQVQMREASAAAAEREALASEITKLKAEVYDRERELEYLKETLPDIVAEKIIDKQEERAEQERQSTELAQFVPPARAEAGGTASAQTGGTTDGAGTRKLAKIYASMRPEDAASILAKLPDDVIIEIVSLMRERSAAKVLSKLDPSTAARISKRVGEQ